MARANLKTYAPYVFLIKGDNRQSEYEAFICIPHKANEKVADLSVPGSGMYTNGTTFLKFEITEVTGAGEGKFFKRIPLSPNAEAVAHSYVFDPKTFCIQIETKRGAVVEGQYVTLIQSTKIFYESADEDTGETGQIAFDCPYQYLVNPHEVTGREVYEYEPYCLVPLREFESNNFSQSSFDPADGIFGQFRQEITLVPMGAIAVDDTSNTIGIDTNSMTKYREIDAAIIEANTKLYIDPDTIEGWVEVIVNPQSTPGKNGKKRKGRLSNASSDTNPTSFIDSPFG